MTNGPDYFTQWSAATDRKLDVLNSKLDDLQQQTFELWQKQHDDTEKLRQEVRTIQTAHGERLATLHAEMAIWRWALVITVGVVLSAAMNIAINSQLPQATHKYQSPPQ